MTPTVRFYLQQDAIWSRLLFGVTIEKKKYIQTEKIWPNTMVDWEHFEETKLVHLQKKGVQV